MLVNLDPHRGIASTHATAVTAAMMLALQLTAARAEDVKPPIDISLALGSVSFVYGGVKIADNMGLFAKHGINIKVIVTESGNAATTALLSGSTQFGGSGLEEVLAARSRRQNIITVVNFYRGMSGSVVLSNHVASDTNVPVTAPVADRLKALNGLTIAVPSATSGYLWPIKAAAASVGATIRWVYMAQPAMVTALKANSIQGFVAAAPFSDFPVIRGEGVTWIDGPKGDLPRQFDLVSPGCLQTTEAYARANPEVVRRMRAVFNELADIIQMRPESAKEALLKAYANVDSRVMEHAFAQNASNWARPDFSEADIEHEIQILKAGGNMPGLDQVTPKSILYIEP